MLPDFSPPREKKRERAMRFSDEKDSEIGSGLARFYIDSVYDFFISWCKDCFDYSTLTTPFKIVETNRKYDLNREKVLYL